MADDGYALRHWREHTAGWRMADGGWRMADKHSGAGAGTQPDGGWRMADGG